MNQWSKRGFTFVEMVVIMGIFATLAAIVTVQALGYQRRASVSQVAEILVSDIRSQQTKAMTGATVGGVDPPGFGVYLEGTRYILFTGLSYSAADPRNRIVTIPENVTVQNNTFPDQSIVFLAGSGELNGFSSGQNRFVLMENAGMATKTIEFNRLGLLLRYE